MFFILILSKTNATKCRLLWKKFFIDLCSNKRKEFFALSKREL